SARRCGQRSPSGLSSAAMSGATQQAPQAVQAATSAQQAEQLSELLAQVLALDDAVDHALLDEELRALEALGELLADGLLDDPRPGEADQRVGLGEDHVAE